MFHYYQRIWLFLQRLDHIVTDQWDSHMQYKHTSKTLPQLAACLSWWVSSHRCCFLFSHLPAQSLQWAYSANHCITVLPYGSCEIKKTKHWLLLQQSFNVNAKAPMCQYKTMLCNRMALNSRKINQRESSFLSVCFFTALTEIVAQHLLSFWLIGVEKWCSISNGAVNHVKCIYIAFLPDCIAV